LPGDPGVDWIVQAPFQRSTSALSGVDPTAMQTRGAAHDTPENASPFWATGFAIFSIDHLDPFQRSASGA